MFSWLISCLCNVNVDDLWPIMEQEKKVLFFSIMNSCMRKSCVNYFILLLFLPHLPQQGTGEVTNPEISVESDNRPQEKSTLSIQKTRKASTCSR